MYLYHTLGLSCVSNIHVVVQYLKELIKKYAYWMICQFSRKWVLRVPVHGDIRCTRRAFHGDIRCTWRGIIHFDGRILTPLYKSL